MQQTQRNFAPARQLYPWELTEETRRVGKQGLAVVRAILEAKTEGPAQQTLGLDFSAPATVTVIHPPASRPNRPLAA